MKMRIEFAAARSPAFPRALALCRRMASFKETTEDGAPLYSVEFDSSEFEAAQAILERVGSWKATACFIDGMLVSNTKAKWTVSEIVFRKHCEEMDAERRRRVVESRLEFRKKIREAGGPGDLLKE